MSEHLPGPGATAAPAAERAEPAAGHRACLGTAAGPPSAAVPVPRALFSQKGIFWLLGAALPGQGKRPGKKNVCKQRCCCGRQSTHQSSPVHHRSVLNTAAQHARILWTRGQPDWPFAPPWAGWYHCLSRLSSSSAGTGAAGVVRKPGLAGQGGQCSAGE